MQSRPARLGLLAAVIVAAVVVFIVLKNNDSDESSNTAKGVQTLSVDASGDPVGGVKTLTYKKGDPIDITIKSDTADEVHFHGYDVAKDVDAGGSVRFSMPATIEGEFIMELEEHKETLVNVKVEPS